MRPIATVLFLAVAALGTEAAAQVPPTVTPTHDQKELNRRAFRAAAEGDTSRAIQLFVKSLAEGELNVTWLNLGRAYDREGLCEQAWSAYARVPHAPRVEAPPPDQVHERLEAYVEDLAESCERPTDFEIVYPQPTPPDESAPPEPPPTTESEPIEMTRVLWEPWDATTLVVQIPATVLLAAGLGTGAAFAFGPIDEGTDAEGVGLLIGAPVGALTGTMAAGAVFGGTGSFWWTALGTVIGGSLGLGAGLFAVDLLTAILAVVPPTAAGSILAYHLSSSPRTTTIRADVRPLQDGGFAFGISGHF